MDSATVEKYLPWMLAGGAVIGGIYLFRSGVGSTSGIEYQTIAPDDVSALQQGAIQSQQLVIQAKAAGFQGLVDTYKTQLAADLELQAIRESTNRDIAIAKAQAETDKYALKTQQKIAKNDKQKAAISVLGSIAMYALLACYRTTELAANSYRVYSHGEVAIA
jgi:hypothetical protein